MEVGKKDLNFPLQLSHRRFSPEKSALVVFSRSNDYEHNGVLAWPASQNVTVRFPGNGSDSVRKLRDVAESMCSISR